MHRGENTGVDAAAGHFGAQLGKARVIFCRRERQGLLALMQSVGLWAVHLGPPWAQEGIWGPTLRGTKQGPGVQDGII